MLGHAPPLRLQSLKLWSIKAKPTGRYGFVVVVKSWAGGGFGCGRPLPCEYPGGGVFSRSFDERQLEALNLTP